MMNRLHAGRRRQRGITLIMGMIMLVLISLILANAFTLSSGNLKSSTNLKFRSEALAAANEAVEQLVGSNFYVLPQAQTYTVNLNNDSSTYYTVSVAIPTCTRAVQAYTAAASDVELGTNMSTGDTWFTDWDIDAKVDDAVTGSSVRVRQGIRVMITGTQKALSCS